MTIRIERSVQARADQLDIWRHVAIDDPDAADRLLRGFDTAIRKLADFPEIGRNGSEITEGLRVLLHKRYLIVYRYNREEQQVTILRIVHGSRDLNAIFF